MGKGGQPKKVDSIVFLVQNLEKSLDFYRNVLRLSLKLKSPSWAEFIVGNLHIALHQMTSEQNFQIQPTENLSMSIQFEVDNIEDHVEYLKLHSVELIGGIRESTFARYAFFLDPDGHILGFREYRKVPQETL